MIAVALLVVMGAATVMQVGRPLHAMGPFLAGVMLAESSYRHELEADIEPFRGILQALFFMAVALSLQLEVITQNWMFILLAVPVVILVKGGVVYGLFRATGSGHNDAIRIAALLPQGGEFASCSSPRRRTAGIFSDRIASLLVVVVTVSMALTPAVTALAGLTMKEVADREELEEDFEGAGADVLMIGFSRFGQIASQICSPVAAT